MNQLGLSHTRTTCWPTKGYVGVVVVLLIISGVSRSWGTEVFSRGVSTGRRPGEEGEGQ
jgi:hypothetical protein